MTKSKMIVGFLLSALFSMLLGPYFERFAPAIFKQTKYAIARLILSVTEEELERAPEK